MRDQFESQPCAYLGITVPNFPNFFYILGPNTVLAHSSLIYMIECQVATRCFTQRATSTLGQLHPSDNGKDGGFKSGHYWAKVRDFEKTRPRSDRRAFQQFGLTMLNLFHWIFTILTSVLSRHMTTILGIHTFIGKQGIKTYQTTFFSLEIWLHLQQLRWCCLKRGCRQKTAGNCPPLVQKRDVIDAEPQLTSFGPKKQRQRRRAPTDLFYICNLCTELYIFFQARSYTELPR